MEGLPARIRACFDTLAARIFTKPSPAQPIFPAPRKSFRLYGTQDRGIPTAAALLGISGHTVGAMIRAGRLSAGKKPQTVTAETLGTMLTYFDSLPTDPGMIPGLIEQARKPGYALTLSVHDGYTATQRGKGGARTGYGPTLTGALVDLLAEGIRNQEVGE